MLNGKKPGCKFRPFHLGRRPWNALKFINLVKGSTFAFSFLTFHPFLSPASRIGHDGQFGHLLHHHALETEFFINFS